VADWGDGTANWTFGELALMYNCPRAATVRCGGGGGGGGAVLWRVDRRTFRGVVAHAAREQHAKLKRALRRGLLEGLTEQQLDRVADAATVVRFGPGEQVIRKGEAGEVFFIIDEGAVLCRNLGGDQADNLLQAGDYFGERALLTSEPRAADVFAEGLAGCTLVALHRDDFTSLLGHLRELLEHNVGMRLLLCMPVLAALSDDDRTALFGSLRVASFASGAAILPAGSVPSEFYIVKEGTVRVVAGGAPAAGAAAGDGGDGVGSGGSGGGGGGGGGGESTPLLVPPPPGGGSPSHARGSRQQPVALLQPGHFFAPRELAALEPVACSYVAEAAPAVPASAAAVAATPAGGDTVDPSATRPPHAPAAAAVQCFVTDRATYMRLLAPYVTAPAAEAPPAAPAASAATRSRTGSSSSSSHGSSRPSSAAASPPPVGEPTSARLPDRKSVG
jgi:CRP-like cAMP-binding protein